jgi:hypothetical protein
MPLVRLHVSTQAAPRLEASGTSRVHDSGLARLPDVSGARRRLEEEWIQVDLPSVESSRFDQAVTIPLDRAVILGAAPDPSVKGRTRVLVAAVRELPLPGGKGRGEETTGGEAKPRPASDARDGTGKP